MRCRIEAQNFAGFARRRPSAIGDDVCRHRGAARSISLVDILNGAFALIAARKIQIDIGPFAAFFGKKTFEKQFHADGIDRRNSQHITDGAVRRRSASLNEDVVAPAELDDVPDDQEIAFERKLLDQLQFALDLFSVPFFVRAIALARSFIHAFSQERRHRLAVRHRIARELVSQILKRECKPGRQLRWCWRWLREDPKKSASIVLRSFQTGLRIARQQAAGSFQRAVIAKAGEDVEDFALRRCRVTHAVGCEQREAVTFARFRRRAGSLLLLPAGNAAAVRRRRDRARRSRRVVRRCAVLLRSRPVRIA